MTALISSDPAGGVGALAALVAGAVSFLPPCVLPLVPGYVSAVVGVAPSDLGRADRRRVLLPSLLFVASFSLILVLLGVGATLIGSSFSTHRQLLDKIGAAMIIALGVFFVMTTFVGRLPRLPPLERVEAITVGRDTVVVPFDALRAHPVTAITVAGTPAPARRSAGVLVRGRGVPSPCPRRRAARAVAGATLPGILFVAGSVERVRWV